MTTFAILKCAQLTPSLTNPRTIFDPAWITELAESIKANGVIQPILARPLPGQRVAETDRGVTHEIVEGECRWRGSLEAGVDTIPTMVKDLTDVQVMEIQLISFLKRKDLSELEEALGYQRLMEASGINADAMAERITKSRAYVYARLKLLDLCAEGQDKLRDGTIDASRALLLARIPDHKLQIKALDKATSKQYNGELVSVRELQTWLKQNVMLKLDHAVFKITDTRLVETAGSCTECPKRTGCNPDIFTDIDSADICTDPACYHAKEAAHHAALMHKAEAKGMHIVQDKEAFELLDGRQHIALPPGYSILSQQRPDLTAEGDKPLTLADALGKDAPAPILFVHPKTQVATELVPTKEAEAVLLAKGLLNAKERQAHQTQDLERTLKNLQQQAERDTARVTEKAVYNAVADAIHNTTKDQAQNLLSGDVLREWLLTELEDYDGEYNIAHCARYEFEDGVDEVDAITAHLQRMGDTDLLRTTAHYLMKLATNSQVNSVATALAKALKVDTKAAEKAAKAEVKAKYADQIKDVQAQIEAQKSPLPLNPAAQAKGERGTEPKAKGDKAPAAPGGDAPLRKRKLSASEAQAAIAAAMQDHGSNPRADAPGIDANSSQPVATPGATAPTASQSVGMAVGTRVQVTSDADRLPITQRKWCGKQGNISQQMDGSDRWMITFKGRTGGMCAFDTADLSVVEEVAA